MILTGKYIIQIRKFNDFYFAVIFNYVYSFVSAAYIDTFDESVV